MNDERKRHAEERLRRAGVGFHRVTVPCKSPRCDSGTCKSETVTGTPCAGKARIGDSGASKDAFIDLPAFLARAVDANDDGSKPAGEGETECEGCSV